MQAKSISNIFFPPEPKNTDREIFAKSASCSTKEKSYELSKAELIGYRKQKKEDIAQLFDRILNNHNALKAETQKRLGQLRQDLTTLEFEFNSDPSLFPMDENRTYETFYKLLNHKYGRRSADYLYKEYTIGRCELDLNLALGTLSTTLGVAIMSTVKVYLPKREEGKIVPGVIKDLEALLLQKEVFQRACEKAELTHKSRISEELTLRNIKDAAAELVPPKPKKHQKNKSEDSNNFSNSQSLDRKDRRSEDLDSPSFQRLVEQNNLLVEQNNLLVEQNNLLADWILKIQLGSNS